MSSETLTASVHAICTEAQGVRSYELRPLVGASFPPVAAGAHLDLHLDDDLVRSYSVFGVPPRGHGYRIAVALDPASRGGSRHLFEKVTVGDQIVISAPRNHFPLVEKAPHSVFIAGGIGITPLWAMIQRLVELGRPWTLHYAARKAGAAAFAAEIHEAAEKSGGTVYWSFDDDANHVRLDLRRAVIEAPEGSHFYCCGPVSMLHSFQDATDGIPQERVHAEYFAGVASTGSARGFVVELARSGTLLTVPEGKTILEVLEGAGVSVPHACREGVCAACETPVVCGTPDHRDLVLSREEKASGKTMMICCSGSLSDKLVLDL